MEKLIFENRMDYQKWINDNELFGCCDIHGNFLGFIKGAEVDESVKAGVVSLCMADRTAYIDYDLTQTQLDLFKNAHCVKVEVTAYLLETVAIIGQTIGQKMYDKNNNIFAVAQDIIVYARQFEEQHKWFLDGNLDNYLDDLDVYCEKVLQDY